MHAHMLLTNYDAQVRAKHQRPRELEGLPYEFNENPLEIW